MPLPVNLSTVTLSGTYVDLQGNPIRGQVKFTPRTVALNPSADTILIPSALTVSLDDNGSFVVVLPATNDTDLIPTGFTYRVEESFTGGRTFDISLPSTSPVINLADIAPSQPNDGSGVIFVSQSEYVTVDGRLTVVESAAGSYSTVASAAITANNAATTASNAASAASAATTTILNQATSLPHPFLLTGV